MGAQQKAEELGIPFPTKEKGYLNLCVRSGKQLITSGHVSDIKGKLGASLSVEQGYQAARECAVKILQSVHQAHGTLDGLRVLKLLGCVNSAPDFVDGPKVLNGASDLMVAAFGDKGRHARTTVGVASLPADASVEVEGLFEVA